MSHHHHQLSLPAAVLININIMLGTGIFINTTPLAQRAGALGAFGYPIIGLLMLPLIICIVHLLRLHPAGGFYTFGRKEISPFAGFISAWGYFTGKLASATLTIHTAVMLIQSIIPSLAAIPPLYLDAIILTLFITLNMLHIKTGENIQKMFIVFKVIPIAFILLVGVFFMQGAHFTAPHYFWAGLPSILPLVLYATVGFEAACSLSSKIKDAQRNAPRAILISYAIVILIATLFQFIFYGIHGDLFALFKDFREPFPALMQLVLPHSARLQEIASGILHLGIAMSALGGGYGILFTNSWNLLTLAENNHVVKAKTVARLNSYHIPFFCVLTEGAICALYLFITKGYQIPLQQVGALGSIIAYTVSALALLYARKNALNNSLNSSASPASIWLPILGLTNCALLTASCVYSLVYNGASSLIIFASLLVFGICMFWYTAQATESSNNA